MVQPDQEVERLVRKHERLVLFAVNRYLKRYFVPGIEREDLVSWGMMGLVQAARAWDPSRAGSFTTLAYKAVERMIVRGVMREWKPERAARTESPDALLPGRREAPGQLHAGAAARLAPHIQRRADEMGAVAHAGETETLVEPR